LLFVVVLFVLLWLIIVRVAAAVLCRVLIPTHLSEQPRYLSGSDCQW
jgi:hypothetical protein